MKVQNPAVCFTLYSFYTTVADILTLFCSCNNDDCSALAKNTVAMANVCRIKPTLDLSMNRYSGTLIVTLHIDLDVRFKTVHAE